MQDIKKIKKTINFIRIWNSIYVISCAHRVKKYDFILVKFSAKKNHDSTDNGRGFVTLQFYVEYEEVTAVDSP
jgi:hypothetical protein